MPKYHSRQTTNIIGEALRMCRPFITGTVRYVIELVVVLHLHRILKAVSLWALQTLPVMKVKNKLKYSNYTLAHRGLIDSSVVFN